MVVDCKISGHGILPVYKSKQASGMDLFAAESVSIAPGQRAKVSTGISTYIPLSLEAQIRPRSGMSLKGLDVPLGTIDADYRGEWGVILANNSDQEHLVLIGDRIAQAVFAKVERVVIEEVDTLPDSERGTGGFGSTGT